MRPQVLLVDDELAVLRALERELQDPRFGVITARSAGEAFALLKAHAIDVVIADSMMPNIQGSELLNVVRKRWPEAIRMMMTEAPDREASRLGADAPLVFRFLPKPTDGATLSVEILKAIEYRELFQTSRLLLGALRRLVPVENPGSTSELESLVEVLRSDELAPPELLEGVIERLKAPAPCL